MRENSWRPWLPGQSTTLPGLAPVIGHRGAAGCAPENTLASFRKAREQGAAWVEFDVMLSRDEVPVLIHDETLERTTNGRGRVNQLTAAELQSLDAGCRFGPEFVGEPIPTLEAAVAVLLELGLGANLQHYNPLIDESVKKRFEVPATWKLVAQMPFGEILVGPEAKEKLPISERLRVCR